MNANVIIKKASDETTRLSAQIGVGSKRHFMLMEHDYLTLKFSTDTPTLLHLGDYVEIDNVGRYELTAPTRGELNKNTNGYDYEIRLEAQYWKFKNKLCKFLPQIGSNETSWTYTDTLPNHAQQILFNLRALAYQRDEDGKETLIPSRKTFLYNGTTDWSVEWDDSVDTTKAVTIQYESKNIIDAIAAIAEGYECEWWFEQNVLHLGKCEYGTIPVTLEINQELVDISRKDSKETYATRLYVYGSDRNIASNYRKSLIFDATVANGKLYDPTRDIDIDWFINGAVTRIADISNSNTRAYDETFNHQQCAAHYVHETNSSHTRVFSDYVYQSLDGSMEYQGTIHALSLSSLVIKFTQHTGSLTGNVRAHVILQVCLDKKSFDYPYDYFEFNVEAPIEALNKEITLQFSDQRIITRGIPTACMMQIDLGVDAREGEGYKREVSASIQGTAAISYYPEWKATGVTIEVLDKKTGAVARTIEGATFNADFAENQRKLTLPPGAIISTGDKYQLPQLNRAIVPARYFTSIYTVFEKYKDITTNGIVNNRLLLPEEDEEGNPIKGYLDAFMFDCEEEAVEDVVVFDDIMPSRVSKIQSITRSDEYTTEQQEQDGSTIKDTYRQYIYADDLFTADNPFNRGDYLIDGANLKVTFQSGLLNGMTFDVELLEDNYHFQIKRDDTTLLPNEVIKPKTGDEFILHGFNIAMLSDSTMDYISNAEKELLSKARQYIAKLNTDTSTYQCTVSCDIAYQVEEDSPDGLYLGIGRSVNLIHPGYFENGRISRVLGYEIPLDFAYDNPVYFIGEKASYSRIDALEDKIAGIGNKTGNFGAAVGGGTISGTGAGSPYVIQQIDSTPPTDKNVYSSLRARLEFALKTVAQTIKHLWTFAKGVRFGTFISGQSGAQIDAAGNAEVECLHVRSWLKVQELIYNRLNAQEGDTNFSDVGTIEELAASLDGTQTAKMRMRWSGDFTAFQPGDIVYGYVNNLNRTDAKEYHKAWAWIKSVDRAANQLILAPYPDSEVPAGVNHALTEGMIISRWGNNIEPSSYTHNNPDYSSFIINKNGRWLNTRQSTFFISTDSGNLMELMGVNKPIISSANMGLVLGKIPEGLLPANIEESLNPDQPYLYARGILVQDLIRIGYEGLQPRTSNYRGQWSAETAVSTTEYYRNTTDMFDTVSHNGAMWQNVTAGTTDEPTDTSSGWLRMTGAEDQTRGLWQIVPSVSQIRIDKNGGIQPSELTIKVYRSSLKGDFEYTSPAAVVDAGAKVQYSIDGSAWSDFTMGTSEYFELESGNGWLEMENGNPIMTEGDDFSLSDIAQNIRFRLVDIWANPNGGGEFTRVTVPVIRDGADGTDGLSITITSTSVKYAKTATATQPADSAFTYTSIESAGITAGDYLWTKTETNYSDGTATKSYTVSRIGSDGSDGIGTPGVDGKTPYVHYAYANSANGQTDFSTTYFAGALYVGVCTDFNQADPTDYTKYEWARMKGEDGRGIADVVEEYALSETTTAPADSAFSTTIPTMTAEQPYLWNREKTTYSDNTFTTAQAVIIGIKGQNGADGATITSVTNYYLASAKAGGVTTSTAGWVTDASHANATTNADKPYLWNYEVTKWSKGADTSTSPHVIGKFGKDGASITITSQTVRYSTGHSASQPADSTFTLTEVPTLTSGQYLWSMTSIVYSDGTKTKSYAVSRIGTDGRDGIDGVDGAQGYGIVASVPRTNFTEAQWSLYGTIGHVDNWSNTADLRNGCRVGDLFRIYGTATDTGNGHVLVYRSDTASGTLHGECVSHEISTAGTSVSIESTSVKYAGSTARQKPADSAFIYNWGAAFNQAINKNEWIYIWSRTEVKYTDGTSTVTYTCTKDGDKGDAGSMVYPAGVFDPNTQYDSADGACPVVEYNGTYYLLMPGFVYNTASLDDSAYPNPAVAAAANYKWEQFTMFKSVFTEVLMANFANIGSMIFYGDTIFSMDGRLGYTDVSTYDYNTQTYAERYIYVTGLDGNGKAWYLRLNNEMTQVGSADKHYYIDSGGYLTDSTFGKFIPNASINFKTGVVQTNNGLEIGQTNNPEDAAVAIVGHGNIISDGIIGGGAKVYEVATTDWNSPAASTISLINRNAGTTFEVNLPTFAAAAAAMGRKKNSSGVYTKEDKQLDPFAFAITYINTYASTGNITIKGYGTISRPGLIASSQQQMPLLVAGTTSYSGGKPASTTKTLKPGQAVTILIEYTGAPDSQNYRDNYTAYIM